MLGITQKLQPSISNLKHESGFTLIEVMIALSFIAIILPVTAMTFKHLNHQPQTERFSVYQFFHVATDEIQLNWLSEQQSTSSLSLVNAEKDQILISMYNGSIRRQVNRSGHEILLRDVQSFEVHYYDDYLTIHLTMRSGDSYEKVISHFIK